MLTPTTVSRIAFFGFISLLLGCRSVKVDQEKVKTEKREAITSVLSDEINTRALDHALKVERLTSFTVEAREGENEITIETPQGKTVIRGAKTVTLRNEKTKTDTRKEEAAAYRHSEAKQASTNSSTEETRKRKEARSTGGGAVGAYLSLSVVFLGLLIWGLYKAEKLPKNLIANILKLFKK